MYNLQTTYKTKKYLRVRAKLSIDARALKSLIINNLSARINLIQYFCSNF